MHQLLVTGGNFHVHDRHELLNLDLDEVSRILSDVATVSDDDGDRVADKPHVTIGEGQHRRVDRLAAKLNGRAQHRVPELPHPGVKVGAGIDGMYAG